MTSSKQVQISALGYRGEGIAREGEGTIFVPLTLPGETVLADVKGNRGRVVEIVEPSPARIAPFCPHFGSCGGCQLQHMGPEAYESFKRGLVVSALEQAGVKADIEPLVTAHGTGRRRATLHATKSGSGYMGLRSHDIHVIETCPILVPDLKNAPEIATAMAAIFGPCDVAFTSADNGLDVHVKGKGLKPRSAIADLARRFDLARISLNGEVIYQARVPVVSLGKVEVSPPVAGFLQATKAAEDALSALVLDAAKGFKSIADLFCGIGPFALRLAAQAPVFALDSDKPAIAALRDAVRMASGLKPVTAETRDLFREPMTSFELNRFDCVVLDPPRAGARAQVMELTRSKIKRIIYVSCDPQSFARDAALLLEGGYRLSGVTPVDQFAWSAHMELVAIFDRQSGKR